MADGTNDFVSNFIDLTKEFESPTSFWKWSAYSLIAAVLRNNVYYEYRGKRIYPNTYTVLLADSAAFRKGAAPDLVGDLLSELANTKVFAGSASIQGVLDKLSQDYPANKNTPYPLRGGSCIILAEELAAFFVADPRLLPLLTNLYDFKKKFDYDLRSSTITIKDVCVSMLAASNEIFLRDVYDIKAVYGGLLRRTLLIKPDERRQPNSLMSDEANSDREKLYPEEKKRLLDHLVKITKLAGPVNYTPEAKKMYNDWYTDLYHSYDKNGSKTGVLEGMHTLVLKLSIIIAAGKLSLEINKEIMDEAIFNVTGLKNNYETFALSAGRAKNSAIAVNILNYIWKREKKEVSHKEIMNKFWHEIEAEDFQKEIETLRQAGLVEMTVGQAPGYKLTDICIAMFEEKIKTKTQTVN